MSFYLDASVIVAAVVQQPASLIVDPFLQSRQGQLMVSDFAAAETAAAVSRLTRMGELNKEDAAQCLSDFDAWRLQDCEQVPIFNLDYRLTTNFVRRFDLMLRAPDALHAAICRRLGATLVTLDQRLAAAAAALGIAVAVPGTGSA